MSYLFKSTILGGSKHGHLPSQSGATFPQHGAVRVAAIGEVGTLRLMDMVGWGFIDFHMEICTLW